jgi:hypothetical protein
MLLRICPLPRILSKRNTADMKKLATMFRNGRQVDNLQITVFNKKDFTTTRITFIITKKKESCIGETRELMLCQARKEVSGRGPGNKSIKMPWENMKTLHTKG